VETTTDYVTPLENLTDSSENVFGVLPDQIGYLQSLGIQYSIFRPTGLMEYVVEHIHVYSGTPWWATIALTAVVVRCVFFKAFINAAENNTRMQAILPITKPITEKMSAAAKASDQAAVMQYRSEVQMIHKRAGVSIIRGFIPTFQFIPAMGTFFLLREMAKLPVPGLETGGILWFQNLALSDPYFILPMGAAGMLYLILRVRHLRYHFMCRRTIANLYFFNRKVGRQELVP
jgi:YidC/Oxa1 family membrane protein insertase